MSVEIEDDGLFIIEGGEVTHIHTSKREMPQLNALEDYLEEWDLEINDG